MRKIALGTWLICMIWVLPVGAGAGSIVPHFLNYQSLLYDDGGNLLADGPADVTFRIKDADGNVLFEERQTVDVARGAVSALVGNGLNSAGAPSGGIPLSVLAPDEGRYLEVTAAGYPSESLMEIVSVPYAVYAEKALGAADESIDGAAIAKKAITVEHLSDSFVSDLATQMSAAGAIATRTDLTNLQTTYRGVNGASGIGVTAGFVYSGSNNLQDVLRDLDRAIQHRQGSVEIIETNITNEIAARTATDTTLQNNINNEASARATADAAEAATRQSYDEDHHNRLSALETIATRPEIKAWGTVTSDGVSSPVIDGYKVSASNGGTNIIRITFDTPFISANYAVTATMRTDVDTVRPIGIQNKTVNGFEVYLTASIASRAFDFIVVGQR